MADVNFVDSLYRNVLAREPDAAGTNYWAGQIAGGANHDQVRAGFLNLAETQTIINPVIRLYEGLLNRAPDADGLKFWADAMRAGKSLNDITNDIMHSPEGTTNGFGDDVDDATFVNNLYLRIGRDQAQIDADPDGVAFWLNALNNTSRATVAQSMLESPENLQNSAGFVTGYTALRAAGNPEPSAAQLNSFSAELDFVDSLYRDVLAREPDAAGTNYWAGQIAGGANHDQVRAGFLNLAETQTIINPVIRLYEGLLNRAPDADGLKFWADAMRAGKSLNDITNDIMHSPEGTTNGFGDDVDDATFVNNLYLRIGRDQAQIDADPDGVAFWLNALNNTSRATVAQSMLESPENLQNSAGFVTGYTALRAAGNPEPSAAQLNSFSAELDFVDSLYRDVLAREPDAAGTNYWAGQIAGGANHDQVRAGFLNLAETQTIINPVIRLYEGLLNRAPDADGLKFWADAMRAGKSLNDITNDIMHSPEGTTNGFGDDVDDATFVNNLYLRIGRDQAQIDADPDGVAFWLNALNNTSRATVAQSMLESPENLQNSAGFVTGYTALRAAGNPGPTTAQLNAFSDTATIEQIIASADAVGDSTTIRPTGSGATPYDLTDTAENLAAADAWELNGATNITATDDATVEEAGIIDAASNTGATTYNINDTAAHLLTATSAVLNGATNVTVEGVPTLAQLVDIDAATTSTLTYTAASGSAAALAANTAGYVTGATNVTVSDAATLEQLAAIDAATTGTLTYTAVSGSAAALAANTAGYVTGATNVTVSDAATLEQLAAIDAATTGTLTYTAVSGSAAALAANTAGYVTGATNVTVSDAATLEQLAAIDAATTGTLTWTAVSGSATELTAPAAATYVTAGKDVTVTGTATIAQLTAIDTANTTGTLTWTAVSGSATELAASTYVTGATKVTVTGSATIAQLQAIDANTTGTLTYTAVTGTAAALAAAPVLLNGATDITATDAATVAQATTIEAATNTGATTYNISDTPSNLAASTNAVLALAGTVTASAAATAAEAAALAAFAKTVVYSVSDTAANLVAQSGAALNEAVNLTATVSANVAQATTIDAATNTGLTTYNINDTGAAVAAAGATVLDHATGIDVIGDAATLTDAQVTGSIIGKFDLLDRLTLNAAAGTTLSDLSTQTLADPRVLALNAMDNAVTLTDTQVTNEIISKFDASDDLTLHASGATVAALWGTTLADADVLSIDVTGDNHVALYDAGDGKITETIIAKFADDDRLTLNADQGLTLSALSAATLGSAKVYVLDATDNQVTLTDGKVTSGIIDKFVDPADHLTLNAPGETLSALSIETLFRPNMTLHATSGAITLTAAQYQALDESAFDASGSVIDANDPFTITSDPGTNALDLNGAEGGAATVVFNALNDGPDDISNFTAGTDKLAFSAATFIGLSGLGPIDTSEFLVAADVSAAGGTGFTGDHRFLYNNGDGANAGDLFYDADGNAAGVAVWVATIVNVPQTLSETDIIMIA